MFPAGNKANCLLSVNHYAKTIHSSSTLPFFNIYAYSTTGWKMSKYWVISGPYFPVFGLNTEIYSVNLRIQSEYRKIRTRNNSAFGHFSRSDKYTILEKINATRLRNQTKLKRIKKLDTSYRQKFWVLWPKFYFWKGDWALSLPNFQILLISPEAVTQRCS